jgi:hypothetical protein
LIAQGAHGNAAMAETILRRRIELGRRQPNSGRKKYGS